MKIIINIYIYILTSQLVRKKKHRDCDIIIVKGTVLCITTTGAVVDRGKTFSTS